MKKYLLGILVLSTGFLFSAEEAGAAQRRIREINEQFLTRGDECNKLKSIVEISRCLDEREREDIARIEEICGGEIECERRISDDLRELEESQRIPK